MLFGFFKKIQAGRPPSKEVDAIALRLSSLGTSLREIASQLRRIEGGATSKRFEQAVEQRLDAIRKELSTLLADVQVEEGRVGSGVAGKISKGKVLKLSLSTVREREVTLKGNLTSYTFKKQRRGDLQLSARRDVLVLMGDEQLGEIFTAYSRSRTILIPSSLLKVGAVLTMVSNTSTDSVSAALGIEAPREYVRFEE